MSKNRVNRRLERITPNTLIVGVDISKSRQYASFVDYRGLEVFKPLSFQNNRNGFDIFISKIGSLCKSRVFKKEDVIIGMEPTGHYWKCLAYFLINEGYKVVCVNPYHTKMATELDDNSPNCSR
jgi:transposase